jgi:hypothetical protein
LRISSKFRLILISESQFVSQFPIANKIDNNKI